MSFSFTSTESQPKKKVPFFEDVRKSDAPYHSSTKNVDTAKLEIMGAIADLGGSISSFSEGIFNHELSQQKWRYGYEIRFRLEDAPGLLRVAGFPFRHKHTPNKVLQVKVQALLNVRDWLISAKTSEMFAPGNNVLMAHLLVDGAGGHRTFADHLAATGDFLNYEKPMMLSEGAIMGEIVS